MEKIPASPNKWRPNTYESVPLDVWAETCSIISRDALVLSQTASIAEKQGLTGHPEVQAELHRQIKAMIISLDDFSKRLSNK